RAGAERAVIALLEQRQHALTKLGELRVRPLTAEGIAHELPFEVTNGAGQGGLRDVALLSRAREIERPGDRQEVADLMHFHADAASDRIAEGGSAWRASNSFLEFEASWPSNGRGGPSGEPRES